MNTKILGFYKITIIISSTIVLLSLIKTPEVEVPQNLFFQNLDKFVHIGMYACLMFVFLWEDFSRNNFKVDIKRKLMLGLLVLLLGISMEIVQSLMTEYRTGDIIDELANSIGLVFGYILFTLTKGNRFLRMKIFKTKL